MKLDSKRDSPWGSITHEISIETDKPTPFFEKDAQYGQEYAIDLYGYKQKVAKRIVFSEITPMYRTLEYGPFDSGPRYHSKIRTNKIEISMIP